MSARRCRGRPVRAAMPPMIWEVAARPARRPPEPLQAVPADQYAASSLIHRQCSPTPLSPKLCGLPDVAPLLGSRELRANIIKSCSTTPRRSSCSRMQPTSSRPCVSLSTLLPLWASPASIRSASHTTPRRPWRPAPSVSTCCRTRQMHQMRCSPAVAPRRMCLASRRRRTTTANAPSWAAAAPAAPRQSAHRASCATMHLAHILPPRCRRVPRAGHRPGHLLPPRRRPCDGFVDLPERTLRRSSVPHRRESGIALWTGMWLCLRCQQNAAGCPCQPAAAAAALSALPCPQRFGRWPRVRHGVHQSHCKRCPRTNTQLPA